MLLAEHPEGLETFALRQWPQEDRLAIQESSTYSVKIPTFPAARGDVDSCAPLDLEAMRSRADVVVLGIDPGVSTTGYGVLSGSKLLHYGKIKTSPKDAEAFRYFQIRERLRSVIREYGVKEVALEHFISFYTSADDGPGGGGTALEQILQKGKNRRFRHDRTKVNPRDMFLMKGAQTVAMMSAVDEGASLHLYTVAEWKGNARLKKEDIKARVKLIFKTEIGDHNINDAVMIANHHASYGWMRKDNVFAMPG